MRTIFFSGILFALLMSASCNGQQVALDKNGLIEVREYWLGTSNLQELYYTRNGKIEGKYVSYHPTGELASISYYIDGQLVDSTINFHKNGKIDVIEYYNRVWWLYDRRYDNGNTFMKGMKKNGTFVGEWQYGYRNGGIWKRVFYDSIGQKRVGTWSYYTEDGDVYKTERYENDTLLPEKADYLVNGQQKILINGWARTFDEPYEGDHPKVIEEAHYSRGKQNGYAAIYFGTGDLKKISFYKNDLLDGCQREYDGDRHKIREAFYKEGKLVKEQIFKVD